MLKTMLSVTRKPGGAQHGALLVRRRIGKGAFASIYEVRAA